MFKFTSDKWIIITMRVFFITLYMTVGSTNEPTNVVTTGRDGLAPPIIRICVTVKRFVQTH